MYANNEVGTIQPVREIGEVCKKAGVPFHTDAVQAVGHIAVDVKADNIDMLSLSGHKFHGPKGVGALYCKRGIPLNTFIEGGAQERNFGLFGPLARFARARASARGRARFAEAQPLGVQHRGGRRRDFKSRSRSRGVSQKYVARLGRT